MSLLVVGIGNDLRGDDGAGLVVARRLKKAGVPAFELSGDLSRLTEVLAREGHVVIVDAVRSGAPCGAVHVLDNLSPSLPPWATPGSTHALDLAGVLALARTLDRLVAKVRLYGIEGADFRAGAGLSLAVERAVEQVVATLLEAFERGERSRRAFE